MACIQRGHTLPAVRRIDLINTAYLNFETLSFEKNKTFESCPDSRGTQHREYKGSSKSTSFSSLIRSKVTGIVEKWAS